MKDRLLGMDLSVVPVCIFPVPKPATKTVAMHVAIVISGFAFIIIFSLSRFLIISNIIIRGVNKGKICNMLLY